MLNFEETVTKLQDFSDKFTTDLDLRDGENRHKPYESLDTFVDYDMIEAALHHLTAIKKLIGHQNGLVALTEDPIGSASEIGEDVVFRVKQFGRV